MLQMQFEYDPDKSAANFAKHGIDFEQAKAIWDDDCSIAIMPEMVTTVKQGLWSLA